MRKRRAITAKPLALPGQAGPKRWGLWTLAGVVSASVVVVLVVWPQDAGLAAVPESLLDLLILSMLLACAAALGSAMLGWLGLADLPRPVALLSSCALGIGTFSLATLAAGMAGLIGGGVAAAPPPRGDVQQMLESAGSLAGPASRWFFFALPIVAGAVGIGPLLRLLRRGESDGDRLPSSPWSLAAVVLVPALIVVIVGSNLPTGVLWGGNVPIPLPGQQAVTDGEGFGYDCLEYHLQAPREFLADGRIQQLPHNVYANFPLNAEMWFMLLMGLVGRPHSAVYLVHWLNVLLGSLAVWGVYLAARAGPGRGDVSNITAGVTAAVAIAAVPMLVAVSVVAYVEPMMLMFSSVALVLLRHYQLQYTSPSLDGRGQGEGAATNLASPARAMAILIGLMLGFAAGTKYLAIPLFIMPLAVALVVTGGLTRLPVRVKLSHAMWAAAAAMFAFSPWLVRGAVQTGNPLFPLFWSVLGGGDWTAADAARWHAAHLPNIALADRLNLAAWRFFSHPSFAHAAGAPARGAANGTSLFGPWLYLLAWPIFFTRKRCRFDLLLLIVFVGQLVFWVGFTAMPGRFMLPAVLVLGVLVGRSVAAVTPVVRGAMMALLLSLALISGLQLAARLQHDTARLVDPAELTGKRAFAPAGMLMRRSEVFEVSDHSAFGRVSRFLAGQAAPHDRPVLWMIGEARAFRLLYPVRYTVAFSRDRLAEKLAESGPAEAANWLLGQGVRYLYVNWEEAERLRGSYGFPASLNSHAIAQMGKLTVLRDLDRKGWLWLVEIQPAPTYDARAAGNLTPASEP